MNTSTIGWRVAYWGLFIVWVGAAALNMLHVHAGFLTNHAADLTLPAWLYIVMRRLQAPRYPSRFVERAIGRTPEIAAVTLFVASTATEVSQIIWPHGFFRGRFDPLDLVAYALGVGACYTAERYFANKHVIRSSA